MGGYLLSTGDEAAFIQLERNGNRLSGRLSESYYTPSAPQLNGQASNVTGRISGSHLTLSVNGHTLIAVLSGHSLLLSVTASDGSVHTVTFRPASTAAYDAAVRGIETRRRVDVEALAIVSQLDRLRQDTSTLAGDSFAGDVATLRSDLGQVYSDLHSTATSGGLCNDAFYARGDVEIMQGDVSRGELSLDAGISSATGDSQTVLGDVATLKRDVSVYTRLSSRADGYVSRSMPPRQIAAAIAEALTVVASLRARVARATLLASQLMGQAKGYLAQANAACKASGG